MAGMPGEEDFDTKKHRKYENSARREYEQAKAELLVSQACGAAGVAAPAPPAPVATPCDMGPESDFEPEPDPEPETARQPVTAEPQVPRSKRDTELPETESAPEKRPADPTPFRLVEVAPTVEPVSLADAVAVPPKRFSSRAMPRGRRRRNRAVIAAGVAPRRSRPARRLYARSDEFDGSTEGPRSCFVRARNQGRTGTPGARGLSFFALPRRSCPSEASPAARQPSPAGRGSGARRV